MPSMATPESVRTAARRNGHRVDPQIWSSRELAADLSAIFALVPPLWPLQDYVAVNPFLGCVSENFLSARQSLCEVRSCDMLPSAEYFRAKLQRGEITRGELASAHEQCRQEYPDLYATLDTEQATSLLGGDVTASQPHERRYFTISEVVDRAAGSVWSSHILNDITRHCAAHFDEGQAAWPSPWQGQPLYAAWRQMASMSRRMDTLGMPGFRDIIRSLPEDARDTIAWILSELEIPTSVQRGFLSAQLFSVAGWASYLRYRGWNAESSGQLNDDLVGLIAIRLAYDLALGKSRPGSATERVRLVAAALPADVDPAPQFQPPPTVAARYLLQVAMERSYRQKLLEKLTRPTDANTSPTRPAAQFVFCIDVRSERMRRHLESTDSSLETFGFAGFFGMAMEYIELGDSHGAAQCPVLLQPAFRISETVADTTPDAPQATIRRRHQRRLTRKVWKSFQTSAVSCFSFVESLGPFYLVKLLTDGLHWTRPIPTGANDGVPANSTAVPCPDLHADHDHGLSGERQAALAESMLRNLGLTSNFARLVLICGHESEVVNTPYKAGLDCGACGGHSGAPNARVAAALLNDPQVRSALRTRGIDVPVDTWFVPAVHNTTTDELQFHDLAQLPAEHQSELADLRQRIAQASAACRAERARQLPGADADNLTQRSRDWSEVRPEWGLAGNAAFIIAPRARTRGLDLDGRTFLHSYEASRDPDLKILELIMTAPMIVTSWINLQYYGSAVDNRSFGSGNKVIHNIVGQFGVLQGNGGDLMTGLPWQSVHDGDHFQHEPLRLLVVIEATRAAVATILSRHSQVRDLVSNGWLALVVLEGEQCYRWNCLGEWEATELGDGIRSGD